MDNTSVMEIVEILFWLALALLYLGFRFQHQELLIGICAGGMAILKIVNLFKRWNQ